MARGRAVVFAWRPRRSRALIEFLEKLHEAQIEDVSQVIEEEFSSWYEGEDEERSREG